MDEVECIVIGAGVIGLAVAARLTTMGKEVLVLEQHDLIGSETSSRNSEVIHAGIYYPASSLKATMCVRGKQMLYDYCRAHDVPHARCGKLIVAADAHQVKTVRGYMAQAENNGVDDLRWLEAAEVAALEPNVRAVGGALSPSTGIVDSHAFMTSLHGVIERNGGIVALQTKVFGVDNKPRPVVHTADYVLATRWLINCGGLHAPGLATDPAWRNRRYFARGHYYGYSGKQPFSRLVYPVAEAGGLGVHVTLDLAGQVKFGPDVQWIEAIDYSFDESRFADFVTAIRRYFPALDATRLHPGYTGIRPKLTPPGEAGQDFVIHGPEQHGVSGRIDLLGIESPGLTASLALAETVGELVGRA
jgi:L-2-hydroxyglutarate oxidase LhgO